MPIVTLPYTRGGTHKEWYGPEDVAPQACPVCDQMDGTPLYRERGELQVVRCASCEFIYVNPRAKEAEQNYNGDIRIFFDEARHVFSGHLPHHRDPNYRAHLDLIEQYQPTGNFLDIGCNMGFFLRLARGRGWTLYGVEPSAALAEIARQQFGLNVFSGYLHEAKYPEKFFHVVTLTDVLEHITKPKALLQEVHRILHPDGILYTNVPNVKLSLLKLKLLTRLGVAARYDIFDAFEHVAHYDDQTIARLFTECGFRPIHLSVGRPIHLPVWHRWVGHYYQYPSPWILDPLHAMARNLCFALGSLGWRLTGRVNRFAPNLTVIGRKS